MRKTKSKGFEEKSDIKIVIEFQNTSKKDRDFLYKKIRNDIRKEKLKNKKLEYKYKIDVLQ